MTSAAVDTADLEIIESRYLAVMRKAARWLARTALLAALGAVITLALGQAYALTQGTCAILCNPRIAGPLGAVAGILTSLMLPSVSWKPLDGDTGTR